MLELTTSVQYVKGIGPRLAEVLAVKDIRTVDDLLHYLPFHALFDGARNEGMRTLRAAAIEKVLQGETTVSEMMRVAGI